MDISDLIVYDCENENHKKTRIGNKNDGGYVILSNFTYDCFIGCGIGNDDGFEHDFMNTYLDSGRKIDAYAFDGFIDKLPHPTDKITFIQKNIGYGNDLKTSNMHDLIDKYNDIFLKMDIESYEFPWMHSLSDSQLMKFKQIVIEFHQPFDEIRGKCLERLANTHYLAHFHANNCCGTLSVEFANGEEKKIIKIPLVFECTYVRKTEFSKEPPFNKNKIPSDLDFPNLSDKEDIELSGYPYSMN